MAVRFDFRQGMNVIRTRLAQAGIDRSYRKVFCIGLHKTGTTSIHQLFLASGLGALHAITWSQPEGRGLLDRYQAFSDGVPDNFAALDREFPRARFILNVRNLDEWLDSHIENQNHLRRHWPSVPLATTDYVRDRICQRNEHHLAVLEYFRHRPDDLLVVNFVRDADAATRILQFIGRPAITARPHVRSIPQMRQHGTLTNAT